MSAFQAVQVTLPTSGSVDATISGFGTPKGAIVIMSNCATTNGSSVSNRFSVGFWDGAAQVCSASGARNGQGTMISRRQSFNDRIAVALNFAGGTPIIEYTIANITDGVRLSVAAGSTTITRIATVVLIGGSDITSVACDQLDLGNTTAAVDHSTIGFEPNIVFVTGSGAGEGVDAAGSNLSFGVAINTGSTVTQRSFTYQDRPSVSTTINDAYVSDTAVAAQLNNRSLLWDCSLSAFDSGGFSTTTSSAAGNDDIMTLSIETALDVSIQDNFLPLSGNVNDTSVGFEPSFVLFGMAEFDNVFDDLDVGYGVSISVYDATNTAEYTLGVASRDNVGTTDSESYHSNNSSLIKWDDGSTAAEFTTTVDSLGYDMTFTANPSTGFRVWSLCVGQPTGGGSNNYDVDINAGSFSVTGGALDLLAARQLSLGAGSFSLVGGGLDLRRGRLLSLESGSFSVAGGDLTVSETVLWEPQPSTVKVWLDADDASTITESSGEVSQWDDKSTNGYSFTQATSTARPDNGGTQNGRPTLNFDGGDWLESTSVASEWSFMHDGTQWTCFIVGKHGPSSNPNSLAYYFGTSDATPSQIGYSLYTDDRAVFSLNERVGTYIGRGANPAVVNQSSANGTVSLGQHNILSDQVDADNATASLRSTLRVNGGSAINLNASTGPVNTGAPAVPLRIGSVNTGRLVGEIAELIIVDQWLSTSERERYEGYLAHKWGLTAELPANHPYKTTSPVIALTYKLDLDAGDFSLTGGDLEQRLGRILGLEAGSFSVNGGDLTLTALSQNVLTLEAGTFAINGGSVNLLADRLINIEGGNFSVNGGDISFLTAYILDLEAGTILLTGQDLNFDKTNEITLEAGDILITGGRINFDYSNAATPSTIIFHHESGLETPTVTDLHPGEIGVNVTTGKIWTLNDDYLLVEVGGLYHGRNLPRIDPAVAGEFWNNDGTLSVSNG
jgi:hypothetical protein